MYKLWFVALAGLLASGAAMAATPITYTGQLQAGALNASYSITTDGTIGAIDSGNITFFTATVSDALSSITFGTDTNARIDVTSVRATDTAITIPVGGRFSVTQGSGSLPSVVAFAAISDRVFGQLQIADAFGARTSTGTYGNIIATVSVPIAASVPEPAAWAMLIAGFATVGAGRRRHRRASIRFGRAFGGMGPAAALP